MPHRRVSLPALAVMVAAPFVAVTIGLYVFHNAWLTVLFYHLQILACALWVPRSFSRLRRGWSASWLLLLGLPCVLAGPLLFVLLGEMLKPDLLLGEWFGHYGLSGTGLLIFAVYYGLLHPLLEQFHWDALRRDPRLRVGAHLLFVAYHVPVLTLLLKPGWVALCFMVLLGASVVWARVRERLGGLAVPAVSHLIADLAVIGAACLLATG